MNDTRILCRNGGSEHTHNSINESRACYGLPPHSSALASVSRPEPGPSVLKVPSWHHRPVSERQLIKIEHLGGKACAKAARYLDRGKASALIDELLHPEREATVTQPDPTPAPTPYVPASRPTSRPVPPEHAMIAGLLPMVPDGYYAVHEYEGGHVDFIRVSRPKKNKYNGAIKVQTVVGSYGGVRLISEPITALWPSGSLSVYKHGGDVERQLLLLVADPRGAQRRYAKLLKHCCRCNAELTDDKSRHYGIGPECVKYWPHIVEEVDMEDAIAAAEAAL